MKKTIKIISKIVAFLILALVILLAVGTALDTFRVKKLGTRAASIHTGDTLQSVISTLGEPRGTFSKGSGLFFKSQHKELAYGFIFDWKNAFGKEPPFFFPFRFRLFRPDSDDLVIVLDDNDRVLEILRPIMKECPTNHSSGTREPAAGSLDAQ